MMDFGDSYFETLLNLVDERNLPHIYLMIPLQKFDGELDQLRHPINYIKTYGVKTVTADIGPDGGLMGLS